MIDRVRRKKIAFHLRQYVNGRFSNQTFEDRLARDVSDGWLPEQYYRNPNQSQDPVIRPMLEQIWFLYSDAHFHWAKGKNAIIGSSRKEVDRYILFLHSNSEYKWPPVRIVNEWIQSDEGDIRLLLKTLKSYQFSKWPTVNFLWNFITRGRAKKNHQELLEKEKQEWEAFLETGNIDYWPFISKAEYEATLNRPIYFCGKSDVRFKDTF